MFSLPIQAKVTVLMLLLSHLKNPTDFLHSVCMHAKLLHSCLIFSDTMDCSLPGSSFHLILQAGILECLAMPFSRRSSPPQGSNWPLLFLLHWQEGSLPLEPFRKPFLHSCCCCCCYSVAHSCPALCNTMDCSMPAFSLYHHLPEFAQIHVHWVGDAIQLYHLLSSPSSYAFNLSQHQGGLFTWGGKNIGTSAPASVLLMNIQSWLPFGLTSLNSCCPRDS